MVTRAGGIACNNSSSHDGHVFIGDSGAPTLNAVVAGRINGAVDVDKMLRVLWRDIKCRCFCWSEDGDIRGDVHEPPAAIE